MFYNLGAWSISMYMYRDGQDYQMKINTMKDAVMRESNKICFSLEQDLSTYRIACVMAPCASRKKNLCCKTLKCDIQAHAMLTITSE